MKYKRLLLVTCLWGNLFMTGADATQHENMVVEAVNTQSAINFSGLSLRLDRDNDQLIVNGHMRALSIHKRYIGHIDIAVYDAQSNLLAEQTIDYWPPITRIVNPKRRSRFFEAVFETIPADAKLIKVAFHDESFTPPKTARHKATVAR